MEDLLSYVAVGARSVENQQHRLTVSGFDIPAGMKNPTGGDLTVMMNSITAGQHQHDFIANGYEVKTDGNPLTHAILRGSVNRHGNNIPNYHYEDLTRVAYMYEKFQLKNLLLSLMQTTLTLGNNGISSLVSYRKFFTAEVSYLRSNLLLRVS